MDVVASVSHVCLDSVVGLTEDVWKTEDIEDKTFGLVKKYVRSGWPSMKLLSLSYMHFTKLVTS